MPGTYRPGDRLSSTRAFAAEWGASRTTVTAAYTQLIAEGYLVTRAGARAVVAPGLFSPGMPRERGDAAPPRLSAFGQRVLAAPASTVDAAPRLADFRYGDLSAGDFPAQAWRRALAAATLRRGSRLRYDHPQGSPALRAALQDYLWRARGIGCTPDDVVIVNGSQQCLDLSARLLLDPGDAVAMENPGYGLARLVFQTAGAAIAPIPVDADGMRVDELPAARLAYVTPSHQYPLGGVLTAARRRALVDWATRHDATVLEDDYDGEYRHNISPIPPLQTLAPDRVIFVGTFSKTLSPTLRLGYLVVPPAMRRVFAEAKRLTDRHTPLAEQEALASLLAEGVYDRHVRVVRRRNAERRAVLLQALDAAFGPAARVVGTATGLHVVAWFDGLPASREGDLAAAAREAGIGLYPIGPLYGTPDGRPAMAGFVIGYAGLDEAAIRRGIAGLPAVFVRFG